MTLEMVIHEQACRGCEMCIEVCPTEVFQLDKNEGKARVGTVEDCIACLSCSYICPSGAIVHSGHHVVRCFYRELGFSEKVERFL